MLSELIMFGIFAALAVAASRDLSADVLIERGDDDDLENCSAPEGTCTCDAMVALLGDDLSCCLELWSGLRRKLTSRWIALFNLLKDVLLLSDGISQSRLANELQLTL